MTSNTEVYEIDETTVKLARVTDESAPDVVGCGMVEQPEAINTVEVPQISTPTG